MDELTEQHLAEGAAHAAQAVGPAPEWMADCPTCTTGYAKFADAVARMCAYLAAHIPGGTRDVADVLVFMEHHLAQDHLDKIPPYDPDCADCTEWQMQTRHDTGRLTALLSAQDVRHRASHIMRTGVL